MFLPTHLGEDSCFHSHGLVPIFLFHFILYYFPPFSDVQQQWVCCSGISCSCFWAFGFAIFHTKMFYSQLSSCLASSCLTGSSNITSSVRPSSLKYYPSQSITLYSYPTTVAYSSHTHTHTHTQNHYSKLS